MGPFRNHSFRPAAAFLAVVALAAVACGDDSEVTTSTSTTTTSPSTTTTAPPVTTAPGEEIDFFWEDGDLLAVVGVRAGTMLEVRDSPGEDSAVAFTLGPLDETTATGSHRLLDSQGIWTEVRQDAQLGWVNTRNLAQIGPTRDATAEVYPTPPDRPRAETMVAMGEAVADEFASSEPASTVTVVDGPSVGDLGEITVDVIGLGDDALGGVRLHLFAEPDPGGESFTLRTLEVTDLCSRGGSPTELCA